MCNQPKIRIVHPAFHVINKSATPVKIKFIHCKTFDKHLSNMKKLITLLVILTAYCINASAQAMFVPGELIVQVKHNENIETVVQEFKTFEGKPTRLKVKKTLVPSLRIYLLRFDYTRITQKKLLDALFKHSSVNIIQNNHLTQLRATIPNDPQFDSQWQYINTGASGGVPNADLDAELAWDITTGGVTALGDTIVVCVVDDGLDLNHLDFQDNRWFNYGEIPDNDIDDEGNGYVDDYRGWNADNNTDDIAGGFFGGFHGTPVAGIVGAKGNNGIGVSGVNWNVKLMIVLGGGGNEAENIAAYSYPLTMRTLYNETNGQEGAFVVATNSSWGTDYGQPSDAPLWCAMYDEMGMQGIISCGATANLNIDIDVEGDLPTACPSDYLISVTNLRRNDIKVASAGYGIVHVDLGAYGEATWTVAKTNSYAGFGGTSGATPHVTGAVGLIYSAPCHALAVLAHSNPAQAALLVKQFIMDGVTPNTSLAGISVTGGRLNLHNSLQLAMSYDCADTGCPTPFAIASNNITDVSASFTWNTSVPISNFTIQYKAVTDVIWSETTATSNAVTLNGLTPCTDYQISIASVCDTVSSSFSFNYNFSTQGCCIPPSLITPSNISDTGVTLTWDNIFGAITYLIEYRPEGSSTWLSESGIGDNNSLPLAGLLPCTSYEVRISTFCSTGSLSAYSNILTFNTTGCGNCIDANYCDANSDDDSYEHIQTVTVGTFTNTSGESGGYESFIALSPFVLTAGGTYAIALTPVISGGDYEEYWKVWIDYNQDGTFDDQTELAFDSETSSPTTVTGNITIPVTASIGNTRMRVIMKWIEEDNTPPSACGVFDYGEVEDYCLMIEAGSACAPFVPTSLQATDISESNAQLDWIGAPSCETYSLQYEIAGSGNWTVINDLTTNSYLLSGLAEGTDYSFQVQCNCSEGSSSFSPAFTFTTVTSCVAQIPTNIVVQSISDLGASITWNALSECVSYTVEYHIVGTPTWQTVFSTNNSTQLVNLTPSSAYEVRISCNCAEGNSTFSDIAAFTTFATGLNNPINDASLLAYPNPFDKEMVILNSKELNGKVDIVLMDVTGKVVWQQTLNRLPSGTTAIPVEQVPNGLYLLQIRKDEMVKHSQKLLKLVQ